MQLLTPIDRARLALERGQRIPEAALPSAIAESWLRCLAFGLDPSASPQEVVTPFAEVARKRSDFDPLRGLALAEMQALHSQIAGSNFMIAFADAEGVVLDTLSDPVFADSAAGRDIIPGSMWREEARGTNALGLALATSAPAAVYGREHFFGSHGALSCMAAPIVDPRGELVGLLDASCANEARQQHTHALVRMAAVQIENSLIFQDRRESFILAFHPRGEFLDTLSAGLLATSADGEVLSVNRAGAALLAGLPAKSGANFAALFDRRFGDALSEMLNGGVVRIRDRAGSSVFMACRRIGLTRARSIGGQRSARAAERSQPKFVCADPRIEASLAELDDALALRMPVHVFGETGVGKELMARHVHETSRRPGAFVAVNCGAIPESLFIAELFGHERGAFTNARAEGAPGLARQADRGTLFLDEVSDIPLAAQTALLALSRQWRDPAGGGPRGDAGRRADRLGDEPPARRTGRRAAVPRGPPVPPQRLHDRTAAASRANRLRRHREADRRRSRAPGGPDRRGGRVARKATLAGEHPRTASHASTRHAAPTGRDDRRGSVWGLKAKRRPGAPVPPAAIRRSTGGSARRSRRRTV